MQTVNEEDLLPLLQACAARAPEPLYPARYAKEMQFDRQKLDAGLDELRRRGLIKLTEWVKDFGQGCTPTDAGKQALNAKAIPKTAVVAASEAPSTDEEDSPSERGTIVRNALFAPSLPYVSRAMLILNLLYFAVGAVYVERNNLDQSDYWEGRSSPPDFTTEQVLTTLGALRRDLVLPTESEARPQWERLLLASFLHIGILHLGMNMFFLFSIAQLIESMWGSWRFFAIYMVSGLVSGCVVVMMSPAEGRIVFTAGASGCLYGIFVALLIWFLFNRGYLPERLVERLSRSLRLNILLLIAINFFANVSWQGHLGGAIGGLLAALLLHGQRFHPSLQIRILALCAVPLVPIGFFMAMLWQAGWI